jgi:hypothetical protein
MASSGRAGCPCCLRHREKVLAAARQRIAAVLTVAMIAVLAFVCLSGGPPGGPPAANAAGTPGPWPGPAARIALIAVVLVTAALLAARPGRARAARRRPAAARDWRSRPPGGGPSAGG